MIVNKVAPAAVAAPAEEPTRVRYGVLAFLCSLSFVLYLDRLCISKAAHAMEQELDISHTAFGFVFSAFTIAYGLFEVPTGRWGDRFGSRGVLVRIVLWWSAFTALTGCVQRFEWASGYRLNVHVPWVTDGAVPLVFNSFMLLLLVRFLFGAGEAGAIPNMARVVARWFPGTARGPAQGLINSSMLIGAALTPIIAAQLLDLLGWRSVFLCFGLVGVAWAGAFYAWFRDDPADHPSVNDAELRLMSLGAGARSHADHPPVPWRLVLGNANVWLLGWVITCSAFVTYMYFTWYPTYLEQARGLTNKQSGRLAALVFTGGAIGCTVGGYFGDWLVRTTGNLRWTRPCLGSCGLLNGSALLVLSVRCDSALASALVASLSYFCTSVVLSNWWAVVTDISGKHVGALFGLMNSMGVPGAVASPIFLGWFADRMKGRGHTGREQWDPGFYVYAAALLLGAVVWLFVNPTKSLVDPAEPSLARRANG